MARWSRMVHALARRWRRARARAVTNADVDDDMHDMPPLETSPYLLADFPRLGYDFLGRLDDFYDGDIPDAVAIALRQVNDALVVIPFFPGTPIERGHSMDR